ncbi:MAG: PilZ domain [Blastocatellia bacterium]|jgi:c-di-GMP-binding flagellar brake protein YcgR|nr:PilZ domain [Blastocatellia bacterium]
MLDTTPGALSPQDRRKYPRFAINSRLTLAVEDESQGESIGIGEPGDISIGGLRVRNLPACPNVRVGDRLVLLLIDEDDALSLRGEVVHHGTENTFGVEFQRLSLMDKDDVNGLIRRIERRELEQ